MEWDGVIERNRKALKRILAMLVAMAGLGRGAALLTDASGGGCSPVVTPTRQSDDRRPPHKGEVDPNRLTLPRHLRLAILRLLRPAESAARRLIVVASRGMIATPPKPRPSIPNPAAGHAALRRLGIAVVLSGEDIARLAKAARKAARDAAARAARGRRFVLPLIEPLRLPRNRRRYVPAHAAPRISFFDSSPRRRLPPPPSPADLIDSTRLAQRFAALASVLDDLPRHARRFARWRARRDAGLVRRNSPLKPGRAPGSPRKPTHEIHEVLKDLHFFAREVLTQTQPDTS